MQLVSKNCSPAKFSRGGWTPEQVIADKAEDPWGPAFKYEGSGWVRGSIGLIEFPVPVDAHFAAEFKRVSGIDISDFTAPIALGIHLPTKYPIARFASAEMAAIAFELSEKIIDWSSWDPKVRNTPEVDKVCEAWIAFGFGDFVYPPANMPVLALMAEAKAHTLNG